MRWGAEAFPTCQWGEKRELIPCQTTSTSGTWTTSVIPGKAGHRGPMFELETGCTAGWSQTVCSVQARELHPWHRLAALLCSIP